METCEKVKKGPGRPKGSKNKPKKVVKIEKKILTPIIQHSSGTGFKVVRFLDSANVPKVQQYVNVYDAPTGNCQLFSTSYFNQLKAFEENVKYHKLADKVDFKPILSAIRSSVYKKNLMFIDVRSLYKTFVKKLFTKDEIITETPYKSSNGSNMVTYIIDMKNY